MEYTRLHITPFNASLLSAIVPPSMASTAKNISFHTIQNFPEKQYGFVDLPVEQAQKIKKKLNGAILRGNKIVINEARPAPRIPSPDVEMAKKEKKRKEKDVDPVKEEKLEDSAKKESKKRKRSDETIKGEEVLDRQIKRGWTDPKADSKAVKREKRKKDGEKKERKKEREKSKYTTEPECLIRTTLPPNVALPAKGIEGVVVDKKAKRGKKDVVLHEFARTEKFATFLRPKGGPVTGKPAIEYIEGKGWIDEDGNVVEGEPSKPKHNEDLLKEIAKKNKLEKPKKVAKVESESESDDEDVTMAEAAPFSDTSSSGSSSEEENSEVEESEDEDDEKVSEEAKPQVAKETAVADATTVKERNVSEDSDNEATKRAAAAQAYNSDSSESEAEEPQKPEKPKAETSATRPITPPDQAAPAAAAKDATSAVATPVNPLEAIYKRRKTDANAPKVETESVFTFGLGGDDIDEEQEEEELHISVPMTPFTAHDYTRRGIRSAAPTPDSAHPNKMKGWPSHRDEDVEEEDESSGSVGQKAAGGVVEGSEKKEDTDPVQDFSKWFYEHRGDTNRAWKKRRKEVKKEVRQRENRKRGNNN